MLVSDFWTCLSLNVELRTKHECNLKLGQSAFFNNRSEKDWRLQNGNVLILSWHHYEGRVRNELKNSKVTMGGIYIGSDWGQNWNPLFVSRSRTLWDICNHFVSSIPQLSSRQENTLHRGVIKHFHVVMYSAVRQIKMPRYAPCFRVVSRFVS